MTTKCSSVCVPLEGLGRRAVVGKFDGGRMSSDAGAVLVRSANTVFNVIGRLAGCFSDRREAGRVEHPVEALIGQRVYGLALGYEDLIDHDRLRDDSVLALALEREDVTGERSSAREAQSSKRSTPAFADPKCYHHAINSKEVRGTCAYANGPNNDIDDRKCHSCFPTYPFLITHNPHPVRPSS